LSSSGNLTAAAATCGTTNGCISLHLFNGGSFSTTSATITLSGTFVATVQFESSGDNGITWVSILGIPLGGGTGVTSATGTGTWTFGVAALTDIRARASAYTSGTAATTIQASGGGIGTAAGVIGLFSACSGTQYLGADAACHAGGGGSGTVTSFSAGTLSPLFTTSVATATTTPALSFTLSNAGAGTLFGNATGASAAPGFTATPVLGFAGTQGTLGLSGLTSGLLTITTQSVAGTPTWTAGTASGTPAVTASAPLAITAATGNLACATCATTTNGGAITGTSPVAVSAAGAISLSGAAGQVPNGTSGAFTATPTLGAVGTAGTLTLSGVTRSIGKTKISFKKGAGKTVIHACRFTLLRLQR